MNWRKLCKWVHSCAVLMSALAPLPLALADGSGPMDPFPITGAYSAFHREDRDHISIIEIAGNYNKDLDGGQPNVEPRAVIAREFFRTHPDHYDFLVAFSTFEFNTGEATAFHWAVQNKVQGIGIREFDNATLFGSNGKLQGFIDMAALSRYQTDPLNPQFETVLGVLAHEVLHQWAAYVKFRRPDGSLSDALLGRDSSHWNFLLDSDASVQYGADWKNNGDGTFTSVGIRKFLSPLDLYLAGFYKPEEVPPIMLIDNPSIDRSRLPQENVTVDGELRLVSIDDIIAAEGPRVPAADQAQKEFRMGFVLLTGPNEQVTDAQIAALNNIRNAFMTRFSILTGGRAVAHVYPEAMPTAGEGTPPPVAGGDPRTTPASLDEGLSWLRARQRQEGFWSDKDTTAVRDTTVALNTLSSLDGSFTGTAAALQWLNQNPSTNTDYLARHARLLAELGGDASPIRAQLAALQNADGGWGIAAGYASNPLDTALAVLALSGSSNQTVLDKAAQYLLSKQNADGGWSSAAGSPSRATVTTAVLRALKALGRHAVAAPAALSWLSAKQNPDGGFGDSPSTTHDTANALQAFMVFDALAQIRPDDAAGYLLSRQTIDGSWDGSVYATASAVATLKRFNFPNWTVSAMSAAPASLRDGDRATISVTVTNDANVLASVGVLRVYDGDPAAGGTQIGPDLTVPVLAPHSGATFNVLWDTFGKAGPHTLVAVVDPDNTQAEMSERDNRATTAVTVQAAPAGTDLSFGSPEITPSPVQPDRLPTTLGISASVRNLGQTDAQNVRVLLWAGEPGSGTLAGETTIDVLNRSTVVANFSYVLTQPGTTTFTIQLDPDNTIAEANETNNAASVNVATVPSVDLLVSGSDISVDKNPAVVGDDITFTIRLHNQGTTETPSTQVRYVVTDGNVTQELRSNTIQIGAGETIEQTLTWRVDLAGSLTFTAQLDPSGTVPELDETNNFGTLALNAGSPSGPNLVVSYQDFTFVPNPGREGYALTLSALVRNTGTEPANNAEVAFYNGDPAMGGTQVGATQVIPTLAAGASATVNVTWPAIPDSADKLLFLAVDPANAIAEFSEDDNLAFNVLPVLSLPDLAVSSGDIQLSPAFPKTGDSVSLSVRVSNLGAQDVQNVVVRAFDGDPATGGTPIGADQTIALLNGFSATTVTFNWTTTGATNGWPIVVQVDPANAILERTKTNNTARRDVAVQDGDLYVTEKYFSPDGDGVKDTTRMFFRLQNPATVTVEVTNKRNKVVRRFSGAILTDVTSSDIIWDGLDDLGRVVQDGSYGMRIVDSAGANLGEILVEVDTNRSSLLEAEGTKFASFSNLTCELPSISDFYFQMTSDDSQAFFPITFGLSPQAVYPVGIYRMEGDGTDIRTIVPESFFRTIRNNRETILTPYRMDAAANGSRVAFSRWNADPEPHSVVDGDGKNLHKLELDGQFASYVMTPNGATVYGVPSSSSTTLVAIAADGFGVPRTLFTSGSGNIEGSTLGVSPDGRKIALLAAGTGGYTLWLVDTSTGAAVAPFGVAVRSWNYSFEWAPNGARLAVVDQNNWRIVVFDQNGALVRTFDTPLVPTPDQWANITELQWAASSSEFAFQSWIESEGGGGGYGYGDDPGTTSDPGGIYVADLVTGKVEKVAPFRDNLGGCEECEFASYHVSTWDGAKWVERGVLHYGLQYQEKSLELGKFLPDASGQYRVRIRQQGMEAAHVESVALLAAHNRLTPSFAMHLGKSQDVLSLLSDRDNEVLDLHGAEMEVRWQEPIPNAGGIKLLLNAREEMLSTRKALPFSYPPDPNRVYEYRIDGNRKSVVDGNQTAEDGLGEPLFKVMSRPDTGHPSAIVYGYAQSDDRYLYAALDFTVDNTLDNDKDWAALRVRTADGWREFRVTIADQRFGTVGFVRTGAVHHTHKYYEFKIPLNEIGARPGDVVALGFQAYGTAAIIVDEDDDGLNRGGRLLWVPGERSLLYENNDSERFLAILLDENNERRSVFDEWGYDFFNTRFSPTGRQLLFMSGKQTRDPTSTCYQKGTDIWSFRSLLNLTADLRAIRSAKAGGIQLKGTASDLNFASYFLEYAPVSAPDDWKPIVPASGQPVVDDLFTTWVPPAPGNYFVRLSVDDRAGNTRRTVKRVSWADTPSITDVYRTPAYISPNGDGVNDQAIVHYRVLEPVHLTFEFFNEAGKRVRSISRDHSTAGIEIDLTWDGRDDNGLPVSDGKYRMTVQNYEFFVTVDNTPPDVDVKLYNAYQPFVDPETGFRSASVAPRMEWLLDDVNLANKSFEVGTGADPSNWTEARLSGGCKAETDGYQCTKLAPDQFTNLRYRAGADDFAGNRRSMATPPGAEELIVYGFGNHQGKAKPGEGCPAIGYVKINGLQYVPMDDLSGGSALAKVGLDMVRFHVAETLRAQTAQLFVQYRATEDDPWQQVPATGLLEPIPPCPFDIFDRFNPATTAADHFFGVTWDISSLPAGQPYIVRLQAIDSAGAAHYSNTFRFLREPLIFRGIGIPGQPKPVTDQMWAEVGHLLQDENKPKAGERILWGVESISEPIAELRLIVGSSEDPRYATPRVVDVVRYPTGAAVFRTFELEACKKYVGHLEAQLDPVVDPVTGEVRTRTIFSPERELPIPCMLIRTKAEPVPAESCDAPSKNKVRIKFAQQALSGTELKLLTLARELPGGGEDVLFNVNRPESVRIETDPRDQRYNYEYDLDTSQLPEGTYPLTARLINVDDQEIAEPVDVQIDRTPPTSRITYPTEGQRLCGVPRQMPDGTIRNVLTLEGEIVDAGGFHYKLELGPGGTTDVFSEFHDSRSLDSRKTPSEIKPPNEDYHLKSLAGPIGELFDLNGEYRTRMRVMDRGGYEVCPVRTFYFDGLVEGARATIDRRLFSPNGDGQFDEVVVNYEVDETAILDIDLHDAVENSDGSMSAVGPSRRRLLDQVTVLPGAANIAWDGRDGAGNVVVDGAYALVLTFRDSCGNLKKAVVFTRVDNTPPAVSIAYPRTSDQLPMIVEIQGEVNDPHLQGFGVDFGVGSFPETWVRLANRTSNTGGTAVLAPWNTFGLEGAHAVRVIATDIVANQRIVEVPVNLAARSNLIGYLEAMPDLFSPNVDGKRETTSIRFGLEEDVLVTLSVLDKNGTVRRRLLSEQPFNKGPVALSWDGKDDAGTLLPDDSYTVGLLTALASNPLLRQDEKVTVVLDATAPMIDVTRPANGFVPASGGITGTIQDANIAEYEVAITDSPQSPSWELVDSGTSNKVNSVLGSLQDRAEGEYALKIDAKDRGEIVSNRVIPFIIDNTPPKPILTAPEKGAFVGVKKNPVNISGTLEEKYLNTYKLNVGSGDVPVIWTELATGTTLPLPPVIRAWDVSALVDGTYTLQLFAEDKAGLTGESRVTLTVDNTPPTAAITQPADAGYVTRAMDIRGSANDANFLEYKLEVAAGTKDVASRWSEIGAGSQPVTDGVLLAWEALPPDGVQTLQLTVKDKADNTATATVQVTVDTKPPLAPVGLEAVAEDRVNARLTWTANTEPDLAGYAVYRDGVRITPELLIEPTYLDPNLLEGRYTYTVAAFDKAGWESEKSNEATLVIDVTPPTTQVLQPGNGTTVSGLFDIKGTAYSVDDFKEYRLFVGAGAAPADFQLLRRSPVPVLADVLTQWNTVVLVEGAQFTLKLEAEDINGNVGADQVTVTIDNLPPAAPTGLVATPSGSNVQLTWNPNTEPDLYGYLVFRNERLANLQGVLVGSLKPYAVVTTSYPDLSLPDGPYTYYILAIDRAGNISDPSNSADVTLDTRAPHATIVQPVTGTRFDAPLYVLATSPDTDIANVQFHYRANGAPGWTDLGPADTATPYEITFDPAALGLPYGDYQLQAIATDLGGRVDPAPTPITVTYIDVTAPAQTLGLATRVNGGDVTLTWTANTDADLAGYHIDRRNVLGSTVRLTSTALASTSYVDTNVADGTYRYTVTAVDTSGNVADPSAEREALVYTPALKQPYTPTLDLVIALAGTGRVPAILSGEVLNSTGSTSLPSIEIDAEGAFTLSDVALAAGDNTITVRLTDQIGNVSKSASVTVASGTAPGKPTGLSASASNYDVSLSWNANPEPDVIGYRVFRNGESLLPDMPMTDLNATASSAWWWSPPQYAVDFNPSSYWSPITNSQPLAGQWLAVEWLEPRIVTQATLAWRYDDVRAVDYDLEAWTGSAWVNVAEVRGNEIAENTVDLARPYRTTRLRLVLRKGNRPDAWGDPVQLSDFRLFHRPLTNSNNFADIASDGNHQYTVSAVNAYAFESTPSDPAALPVGDVTPPEPVSLSASVAGADVSLSWTASASSDVVRYTIYRDGSLIATHTDLANLIYLDAGRPNGTYVYVVRAMDNANNESVPSNEAPATVAIAPPPAPVNLAVTVAPEGGALDLAWASGSGLNPSSYRIFRATGAGGPYQPVGDTPDTQRRDTGLVNGTTYFYVVAALDAFGNASVFSNEASGTPLDKLAPLVDLHHPTVPGRLHTTEEVTTTIVGSTEPGAAVALWRDGSLVATRQALAANDIVSAELQAYYQMVRISPDGRYGVYQDFDRRLRIRDLATGVDSAVLTLADIDEAHATWSADGKEVFYIDRLASSFNHGLRAYRVADKSIRDLTGPNDYFNRFVVSPDRKQLALYGDHDGDQGWWRLDLATRALTLLPISDPFYVVWESARWSPDGARFAYFRWYPKRGLEILHVPTGNVQIVDAQARSDAPSWSPDASALVFVSERDGTPQLWRFNLSDGSSTALTQDADDAYYSPVWAPDGRRIAYGVYRSALDRDVLEIRDLSSASVSRVVPDSYLDTSALQWGSSGYLGVWMDDELRRVALAGRVEFNGIELAPGDNVFTATATDSGGNTSGASPVIVVNLNTGNRPDLAVADGDIRILPAARVVGDAARISVKVRNIGRTASPLSDLTLVAVDPQGNAATLVEGKVLNPLAAGGTQTVSADWTVTGEPGDYTVVAIVDPLDEVVETSETNNLGLRVFAVPGDAGQTLSVATDKASYLPGETVAGTTSLANFGDAFSGRLEVAIEDQQGYLVQTVLVKSIEEMAYSATLRESATWPTGTTFAGGYQAHARLYDSANRLMLEATAPFSISAASEIQAQVSTDRAVYVANNNVRVDGAYAYAAGNATMSGAEAILRIVDDTAAVLAETRQPLGELLPGASGTLTLDWNTGTQAAGSYRAVMVVARDNATLTMAEAIFQIESSAADIGGVLQLSEPAPAPGVAQIATFNIRNRGNVALTQLPIVVSLVDPDLAMALETQRVYRDLDVDAEVSGSVTFSTAGLALKTYTVVLQTEVPAGPSSRLVTLATAGFSVVDRTPPGVDVREPGANGFIRGDGKATVFARDALSAVTLVEISVDAGPWIAVPVHNAADGLYGDLLWGLPEGVHQIAARATDAWNNTGATMVLPFVVDNTPPQIDVQGVSDGGSYNADVAPYVTFSDANLEQTTLTLNGESFVSGTGVVTDGNYLLFATAGDKAGNRAQTQIRFTVDKISPQIVVTGVQDAGLYNVDVTPIIEVSDTNLAEQNATLNGQPFASGTPVTAEGNYELVVDAADTAGNLAHVTIRFTIDKTAPAVIITEPGDGATLSARTADVRGRSEPSADVFLTVGSYQAATTTDAQGAFAFAQVPLMEGENVIEAYARDAAGNVGAPVSARVRVVSVQLDGGLISGPRVLVWLPAVKSSPCRGENRDGDRDHEGRSNDKHEDDCDGHDHDDDDHDRDDKDDERGERHGSYNKGNRDHDHKRPGEGEDCYAPLSALIDATMGRDRADYLIVRSEKDFLGALRTRRYNTILLAELHHGEHCGSRGDRNEDDEGGNRTSALRMSASTRSEIEATVAAGTGIVWIKTHPDNNEHWQTFFGAKPRGVQPKLQSVELTGSAASAAGTWQTSGFGLRTKLRGGTAVGELNPGGHAALILHRYGQGKTALVAFNPSSFADPQGSIDTLAGITRYAAPTTEAILPGGIVGIRWTASRLTPPQDVELREHLPVGMKFVSVRDGMILSEREAAWERSVTDERSAFDALVRLPDDKGNYIVTAELFYRQGGSSIPLIDGALAVVLTGDREEIGNDTIAQLEALSVAKKHRSGLNRAITYVQNATSREQATRVDAAYSITKLLMAFDELQDIPGVPADALASVGRLLGVYQVLWHNSAP